ncbi:MAG: hypothetical protein LBR25_00670 [Erysipelotrichaceae bacterium]|jgi:hypothetical protein|nr:hypothetical protein [Erysipelotrichaceae bacterium]
MKKKLILLGIGVLLASMLAGCAPKKGKITIITSDWVGVPGYEPEEVTYEFDLKKGEVYETDRYHGSVKVVSVSDKSITIETSIAYSIQVDGGIDLSADTTTFEIPVDTQVTLITPSFDEGEILIISWKQN